MVRENLQNMNFSHMDRSPDPEVNRWAMVSQNRLVIESKVELVRTRHLPLRDYPMRWCSWVTHQSWTDQTAQTHLERRVSGPMETDAGKMMTRVEVQYVGLDPIDLV